MKLLVTADIHIGRPASHLPAGVDGQYSTGDMWLRMVDYAIETKVDAVLASGDLTDSSNDYFEAYVKLEDGVRKLDAAGIRLFAVAGNHDYEVLPRLHASIDSPHFVLLGRDNQWTHSVLEHEAEKLQIFGWSFPKRIVTSTEDPLQYFPVADIDPDIPAIGMLHGDLFDAKSPYCPVTRPDFERINIPLWILGHIHKPSSESELEASPRLLYPGSPQGLHPKETGPHGPWLITYSGDQPNIEQLPMAPVRYQPLTLQLQDAATEMDVLQALTNEITTCARAMKQEQPELRGVSLRLEITGQCDVAEHDICNAVKELQECIPSVDDMELLIDDFIVLTLPKLDLSEKAKDPDPLGIAAKLYLELDGTLEEQEPTRKLLAQTEVRLTEHHSRYSSLAADSERHPAPDAQLCRTYLIQQVSRLIDHLWRTQQVST